MHRTGKLSAKGQYLAENFDLIVCSFNLTKRQDGYQLYEELRFKRLIKHSTGFIFISAQTYNPLVHSVLELQPDDFLVKPFTNLLFKRAYRTSFTS
ncbi:MAG: response regulator [Pseudoalteromonas sp.]